MPLSKIPKHRARCPRQIHDHYVLILAYDLFQQTYGVLMTNFHTGTASYE